MTLSVVRAASADAQRWDAYVTGAADAALYHLYGWRRVVEETFGHQTIYLAAVSGSTIVGVFPLVQLKSLVFGHMLVSMPFFNYGGISASSPDVRNALMDAAIDVAKELQADFIEVRHEDEWDRALARKTTKVAMRLSLPSSSEELWKSFPSKLRTKIQRPRKEGMTSVTGGVEELDSFYDVFSRNMRDLGTPVYSKSFFQNILTQFPEQSWISTVYMEERPVASGFLIAFKDRLEIPWASAVRDFNKLRPNTLLYWNCLEFACQRGYRVFDFGRSTPGEGTFEFKEQWGAKPSQLDRYYWLRNGSEMPQVNPKNPKFRMAIALWQRLPLTLTRQIGPKIVKYIP